MFGGGVQVFGESSQVKEPRKEEKMTVLPTTIRAVEKAISNSTDEADIRFYGTQPGMLVLVGVVESVSKQSACMEFWLNDATGRLRARYFATDDQDALANIEAGKYVVLAGELRLLPAAHISVTTMRPVRSADEVSYHMIESAHAALKLQRGPAEPMAFIASTPVPKRSAPETLSPPKESLTQSPLPAFATASPPPQPLRNLSSEVAGKGPQALEGDALRRAVMTFLQKEGEGLEEGVSLAKVCGRFLPASENAVRTVLAQLVSDGEVFNTIDDDHFSAL